MSLTHGLPRPARPGFPFREHLEFQTYLSLEGSIAKAGRLLYQSTRDPVAACKEMLRDHLTVSFASTDAAFHREFDDPAWNEARERARVALGLQRAALLMRRNRLLQALVENDDVLQLELAAEQQSLTRPDLDAATRAQIEENIKMIRVRREDLVALARIVLEQKAIREIRSDQTHFTEVDVERFARAAEARVAAVMPALQRGVPLRRALAMELAAESMKRESVTTAAATAEMPRKTLMR